MPETDRDCPDALVLAALKRACAHKAHDGGGTAYSNLVAHLGLRMRSSTGRWLRPKLHALTVARLVVGVRRGGIVYYELTPEEERVLELPPADRGCGPGLLRRSADLSLGCSGQGTWSLMLVETMIAACCPADDSLGPSSEGPGKSGTGELFVSRVSAASPAGSGAGAVD